MRVNRLVQAFKICLRDYVCLLTCLINCLERDDRLTRALETCFEDLACLLVGHVFDQLSLSCAGQQISTSLQDLFGRLCLFGGVFDTQTMKHSQIQKWFAGQYLGLAAL